MTLGGTGAYYVSFDNVAVGALMARGLVNCIRAWHVRRPDVLVMHGAPTDNNTTLFARGYDGLRPFLASRRYTDAGRGPAAGTPRPRALQGPVIARLRLPSFVVTLAGLTPVCHKLPGR
jgi:D-xylose transport system substrate-binding protein